MGIAYHLSVLQREFQSGKFNENVTENIDEMHFVVNLDNGHILGFREDTSVTYNIISIKMGKFQIPNFIKWLK